MNKTGIVSKIVLYSLLTFNALFAIFMAAVLFFIFNNLIVFRLVYLILFLVAISINLIYAVYSVITLIRNKKIK